MNDTQVIGTQLGERRNVASSSAAWHLDIVGDDQYRASRAFGRRGSGD
jgi:hypothetical protein